MKSETVSSISHEHILRLGAFRHLVNLVLMVHYWIVVENPLNGEHCLITLATLQRGHAALAVSTFVSVNIDVTEDRHV